ncbi:hypothetical protein GIB67_025600 [Kingdonia uniflora]|uniref:RNase H type-1 domain-containing protein n=1 Tax=Kingdonia uniflora TaxID=39325 RepID=A0A7J7M0H6_9MAGN|nr:hypothetical protein GIB67_025600 [Kingdonia uniflora]
MIKAADNKSSYIMDLCIGSILGGAKILWLTRSRKIHDNDCINMENEKRNWLTHIQYAALTSTGCMHNTQEDLNIVHVVRIPGRPRKETLIKSCFWELPSMGEVEINTDGALKGNPGKGGVGYIIRNCEGALLRAGAKGLGTTTSFLVECQGEWHEVTSNMEKIRFSATWREANFSAGIMANRGVKLQVEVEDNYVGRPQFLYKIEEPMREYFRFFKTRCDNTCHSYYCNLLCLQ